MKLGVSACAILVVASFSGCSSSRPQDQRPSDPDMTISDIQRAYGVAPAMAPYRGMDTACGGNTRSRAMLRKQAENLSFRHPNHVETRLMAGILAYEFDDRQRAMQHLDQVLKLTGTHPEAAVLRSRIALEQGNVPYAVKLLDDQVRLRPDHGGLREAHASALYMSGDLGGAMGSLAAAEQLGSPAWRVAYNRGLIEEEQENYGAAVGHYQQALALSPGWPPARERLTALEKVTGTSIGMQAPAAAQPATPFATLPFETVPLEQFEAMVKAQDAAAREPVAVPEIPTTPLEAAGTEVTDLAPTYVAPPAAPVAAPTHEFSGAIIEPVPPPAEPPFEPVPPPAR